MPLWLAERWGPGEGRGRKLFAAKNNSRTKRGGRGVSRGMEKRFPWGPALKFSPSEYTRKESLALWKTFPSCQG